MKCTVTIQPISQVGQCILTIRRPTDSKYVPSVSLQFPVEVAEYVKWLIERDQLEAAFLAVHPRPATA